MSERKFFKQTFTIVVYSEDAPLEYDDLDDIHHAISEGDCVGSIIDEHQESITGKQAADGLSEVGSEPGFFRLDDDGNTVDDDYLEEIVTSDTPTPPPKTGWYAVANGHMALAGPFDTKAEAATAKDVVRGLVCVPMYGFVFQNYFSRSQEQPE